MSVQQRGVAGAPRHRPGRLAAATWPGRRSRWSRSPSPRPATCAAATAAWTSTTRTCARTSPRCAATATRCTAPGRLVAGLAARRAAGAGPLAVVSCDNLPGQRRGRRPGRRRPRRGRRPGAGELDPRPRRRSSPRWSTGSRRAPPPTTCARSPSRPAATTRRRWSPSRSPSGCSAATSRPAGPAWEAAGARFVDDVAPVREAQAAGCSTADTRCSRTPGSARGHETIAEAVADPVCRGWLDAVVGRGRPAPAAARRGARRLPGGAAGAVREPADPAPAGADRRGRLAEGADPGAAGAARRAGRRPDARRRRAGPGRLDRPPARDRRTGQTTPAPARTGSGPDRARDVLALLAPDLAGDTDLVDAVEEAVYTADRP